MGSGHVSESKSDECQVQASQYESVQQCALLSLEQTRQPEQPPVASIRNCAQRRAQLLLFQFCLHSPQATCTPSWLLKSKERNPTAGLEDVLNIWGFGSSSIKVRGVQNPRFLGHQIPTPSSLHAWRQINWRRVPVSSIPSNAKNHIQLFFSCVKTLQFDPSKYQVWPKAEKSDKDQLKRTTRMVKIYIIILAKKWCWNPSFDLPVWSLSFMKPQPPLSSPPSLF